MFNRFRGFHAPSEADLTLLWKTGTFVFDTGVLLDLYRVPDAFDQMRAHEQSLRGRVFLPYQFALEFHRNLGAELKSVREKAGAAMQALTNATNRYLQEVNLNVHPVLSAREFRAEIEAARARYARLLENALPGIHSEMESRFQAVTAFVERFFEGRLGPRHTPDRLWALYEEGERRFNSLIPPGFKDAKDKKPNERKYGDLVGWMQILDHAKENGTGIIFVTEDRKSDWWQSEGIPHPYLVQEMIEVANQSYYQYDLLTFFKTAAAEFKEQPPGEDLSISLDATRNASLSALSRNWLALFDVIAAEQGHTSLEDRLSASAQLAKVYDNIASSHASLEDRLGVSAELAKVFDKIAGSQTSLEERLGVSPELAKAFESGVDGRVRLRHGLPSDASSRLFESLEPEDLDGDDRGAAPPPGGSTDSN